MNELIHSQLKRICPTSEAERAQWMDAMAWVASGAPLFRTAKPATPPKHLVAYFPIIDGDYILLVDHKNAKRWLPTGGHVEAGENPRATVVRELREELGLEISEQEVEAPLMVSVTETVGLTSGHTDVSLWYPVHGSRDAKLTFDASEFNAVRWFHFSEVPLESTDPNLGHFLNKLRMTSPSQPAQIFFLPGALGRTQLWEPVANMLACPAHKEHIGWPGFGSVPASPSVHGLDDLAEMVLAKIDRPTALVAQSMGGVVAVLAALRKPELITHLVLAATSGGVDVAALGGTDWRPAFHEAHPQLPRWFSAYRADLSAQLQTIAIPVLLLWGDADPISPVSVGQRLAALLPRARLQVFANGDHDLAETQAAEIAPLIDEFLVSL